MTPYETTLRRIQDELWAPDSVSEWYHGGVPGLRVGDRILPPSITGNMSGGNRAPGHQEPTGGKFVYVTPDRNVALRYAVNYPDRVGTLYRCEPIGRVKISHVQRMLALDLIESGYDFERIAAFLAVPTMGSKTYVAKAALIYEVIGQPWQAPAGAWWRARSLPSDSEMISDALIERGITEAEWDGVLSLSLLTADASDNARRLRGAFQC